MKRAVIIVLDGVGIGELPDADRYGDRGSNTLGNIARAVGGLHLPHLAEFGLGNIAPIKGIEPAEKPKANFGKMAERAPGKDSTSGHWEIAGCTLDFAFPTYPNGFPPEVLKPFEEKIGRGILGNKPASGTEIIKELGMEHLKTGYPIVYTSADSVFQIAAHEEIIPLDELYEMCQIGREILTGKHAVSRVIARPFIGDSPETFTRTRARRDFSLKPPKKLLQSCVQENGLPTVGIGKIDDLYAGVGLDVKIHTKGNEDGMNVLAEQMKTVREGLIMINLVDFDMLWGHRNNPAGFYEELQRFDRRLPEFTELTKPGDVLIITADHGNDPTTPSTDHSREYVPLLVHGPAIRQGVNLKIRESFADLGKTVAEALRLENCAIDGTSFWTQIS
ncbi:phosphopentomutase [candidate division KSB1 bacterium 4484_188]|nr:MAG: phosphopentomutase [candidate division KSB1 bacterium 4484_188]HFE65000.1 phosphopentomutase [Caldithrix sp.]